MRSLTKGKMVSLENCRTSGQSEDGKIVLSKNSGQSEDGKIVLSKRMRSPLVN